MVQISPYTLTCKCINSTFVILSDGNTIAGYSCAASQKIKREIKDKTDFLRNGMNIMGTSSCTYRIAIRMNKSKHKMAKHVFREESCWIFFSTTIINIPNALGEHCVRNMYSATWQMAYTKIGIFNNLLQHMQTFHSFAAGAESHWHACLYATCTTTVTHHRQTKTATMQICHSMRDTNFHILWRSYHSKKK